VHADRQFSLLKKNPFKLTRSLDRNSGRLRRGQGEGSDSDERWLAAARVFRLATLAGGAATTPKTLSYIAVHRRERKSSGRHRQHAA